MWVAVGHYASLSSGRTLNRDTLVSVQWDSWDASDWLSWLWTTDTAITLDLGRAHHPVICPVTVLLPARGRRGEIYSREWQSISETILFFCWESWLYVNLQTYVLINIYWLSRSFLAGSETHRHICVTTYIIYLRVLMASMKSESFKSQKSWKAVCNLWTL